jgi:hypothetical protein
MESAHFLDLLRPYFEGEVQGDDLHRMLYATDASVYRMMPLGVVFPKHVSEIQHPKASSYRLRHPWHRAFYEGHLLEPLLQNKAVKDPKNALIP